MIRMTERLKEILDDLKVTNADTYYHALRVKSLTFKMIREMNKRGITSYSEEDVERICKGALLHDVGKLCVRNFVLTKDGFLTQEERQNMAMHTRLGFESIKDELTPDENEIIRNICLYHHERVDGGGNEGVKDLPEYVQAVAISDVFDALHTDRVYRPKFDYEETLSIIRTGKSGYFEPWIIEILETVTEDDKDKVES